MSQHYGVPAINLDEFEIDEAVINDPSAIGAETSILPINRAGSVLIVAMSDPSNLTAIDDVKFNTGYNVEPVVASDAALAEAIERYYDQSAKNKFSMTSSMLKSMSSSINRTKTSLTWRSPVRGPGRSPRQPHPRRCHQEERIGHYIEPYEKSFRSVTESMGCSMRS